MKRRDFLTKSAIGALVIGSGSLEIAASAENSFGPKAEIKPHNGSPALYVDGKPIPPMVYTGNPTRAGYVQELGKSGIQVYFIECDLEWAIPGAINTLKKKADFILENNPGAYLILRVLLHPPVQWIKDNPDELVRYENGETMKPSWAIMRKEYMPIGTYSLTSMKWREDSGKALVEFIDLVEKGNFGHRVIGYFLGAGGTWEWYYPGSTMGQEHYADFSPAYRHNFSTILQETYGTEDNLKKAWNNSQASFDKPKIPNLEDRYFCRVDDEILSSYRKDSKTLISPEKPSIIGCFLNPETHRFVADYYKAWHAGTADSIIHFARVVKERTRNTKVVGAFYGSYGCTHFQEGGTAAAVLRILDSGYVDFLAAPGNYENRLPGGVTAQREMQDSFRLRNRIFLVEEDTRTHLSGEVNCNFTGTHTLQDSITNMKRDFGRDLSEDLQAWWYDMAAEGGWYDHPDILSLIKRQQEIAKKAYDLDRRMNTEIALLYDQDSLWFTSQRTLVDVCHMMRNLEIHKIGAPVNYYFHDDLSLENMPEYKLYVFMNCFVLSDKEREVIEKRVKTGGKTALWLYAPGIINLDKKPHFSTGHITELTGINVGMEKGPVFPACRLVSGNNEILKGVPVDKDYGYFDREMFGTIANVQPPGPAWSTLLYPCIYGDDPEAEVLAAFKANNKPALLARDFGNWHSIYSGFKAVRSDLLRAIARYAGCHIYAETDDVLYANRHFVTLHASTTGEKVIRFPEESDVFEIYEKRFYGMKTKEVKFSLQKGETKTFYLHGEI